MQPNTPTTKVFEFEYLVTKQPNTFATKGKNICHGCWSMYSLSCTWVTIMTTPLEMATLEIKSTWMGSIMTTSTKVQTPTMDNTMFNASSWGVKQGWRHQKNMCIFKKYMKFDISSNKIKGISNDIIRNYMFLSIRTFLMCSWKWSIPLFEFFSKGGCKLGL